MSKEPTETLTLIAYCDGSARPTNPGYAGYGIFGYTFKAAPRPKNTKHPIKAALSFTTEGISKDKSEEIIEVVDILEVSVALQGNTNTNNVGELKAALHSLKAALHSPEITKVVIIADSRYFTNNFKDHLKGWANNGFKKLSGELISNVEVWGELELTRNTLVDRGVQIEVKWIKGHSDDYGNDMSDTLSVIASNAARVMQESSTTTFNPVVLDVKMPYSEFKKSYDNKDVVYHFKDLFFSSSHQNDEDYCFLSSTEDEVNVGRRVTDAIFAVNQGSVPSLINRIKKFYRSLPRSYVCNCSARLSKFENRDILRLAEVVPIEYLLIPVSRSTNQFSLIGTDKVFLQENTMEFPFIVNISKLTNAIVGILSLPQEEGVSVDVSSHFIKEGKLLITNKDKHIDLSAEVSGRIKFCQKPLLGIAYDVPNYLTLKKVELELKAVHAVFHKNEHNNFYTLYTKIATQDRVLCCINMVDKYLAVL